MTLPVALNRGQEGHRTGRRPGAVVDFGILRTELGNVDTAAAAVAENAGHLLVDVENGFNVILGAGEDVAVAHGSPEFAFAAGTVQTAAGREEFPVQQALAEFRRQLRTENARHTIDKGVEIFPFMVVFFIQQRLA
jgi:hypothetical protein